MLKEKSDIDKGDQKNEGIWEMLCVKYYKESIEFCLKKSFVEELVKEFEANGIDILEIKQRYVPIEGDEWVAKTEKEIYG